MVEKTIKATFGLEVLLKLSGVAVKKNNGRLNISRIRKKENKIVAAIRKYNINLQIEGKKVGCDG